MKNEKKLKVFAQEIEKIMSTHNLEVLMITESNMLSSQADSLQAHAVVKNESNPYRSFLDLVHNILLDFFKQLPLNNVLIQTLNMDTEFNKFEARLGELISKIADYTSIIHNDELIDNSFLGIKLYPGQVFKLIKENQQKQNESLERINSMVPFSSLKYS
jgi:hypothetical protein